MQNGIYYCCCFLLVKNFCYVLEISIFRFLKVLEFFVNRLWLRLRSNKLHNAIIIRICSILFSRVFLLFIVCLRLYNFVVCFSDISTMAVLPIFRLFFSFHYVFWLKKIFLSKIFVFLFIRIIVSIFRFFPRKGN